MTSSRLLSTVLFVLLVFLHFHRPSALFADAKELWEYGGFNNITDIDYTYSQYQTKRDLPTGTCNSNTPCANGACCGSNNLCGYSPASCGTGCQSNCNSTAECGPYAAKGEGKCPLNVCCSEFGFCGSTTEFCVWTNPTDPNYSGCSTKYGGCGSVNRPSCGGGSSVSKRNVGYYESWANTRACQSVSPEQLNLDGFTSINFAFASFDATSFEITPMDSNSASLYSRFTNLKNNKPGLQTFISVGGWSFTDPGPTQKAYTNMVSSAGNRATFIKNIMKFMSSYGFDGVDLDWEYPGADDRGGVPADTANYVALVKEMSAAFGSKYQLTVTIPTSFWYLQHFDVANMQDSIGWFNLMAYDLHGVWDAESKFVGPYIAPHTNLTEIDLALDLLWRAGVDSSKVVMGQGWYGRSFTLQSSSCNTPNGVCQFTGGAQAGPCSQSSGILDYQEISDIIQTNKLQPVHDETAGVKWITWNSNQWVSYDDADTFKQKRDFANSRCLSGLMVWAMDQVDQTANNGFGGAAAAAGTQVTSDQQASANQASSNQQASVACYTSDCGVSCKAGTTEVAQFNGQPGQLSTSARCAKKQYRSLCCDDKAQVGQCTWRGYRGSGLSCTSGCASGETELTTNTDQHTKKGDKDCHGGLQSFCCGNFKPSPNSLTKDLEDAAKAAAEAAAEQAALDIAAKAFCRVAVPALLAPLELLEDLIPIVGEIADAIEIAATPGIIEGCVKGIEKEGKAEFKVFGKKHTLSLNEPATKPTDIPDRPPSKTDNPPAKTGDKGPTKSCQVKSRVRRVEPVIENRYLYDTPQFTVLKTHSPYRSDDEWQMNMDGKGFALQLSYQAYFGMVGLHGLYIAGYVSISHKDIEHKNDCGEVTSITRNWIRGYNGLVYDLGQGGNQQVGQCILIPRSDRSNWIQLAAQNGGAYTWLGPIRTGLTEERIVADADMQLQFMGQYDLLSNNCYTFVRRMYTVEQEF
ncbi:glycoside hydrolase family 18 protein [Stipitochalara longipes BDJ]|nr:glycoside hydrolase family 18 protein [Stipitochalara longipes BDJ]